MATPTEIQSLLRFLTQSASIPLVNAMSLIPKLKQEQLTSASLISARPLAEIRTLLYPDDENDKAARQLHNAAKRAASGKSPAKRKSSGGDVFDGSEGGGKRRRKSPTGEGAERTEAEVEANLELPEIKDVENFEHVLRATVLFTNRAPLLLAFAVVLLKYTMPAQPLSSRLSLAQAMVSTGARARAYDLGIEKEKSAEMEGWGKGQPTIKVVGREIKVLRRWGYEVENVSEAGADGGKVEGGSKQLERDGTDADGEVNVETTDVVTRPTNNEFIEPPLWGMDLEALKKFNASPLVNAPSSNTSGLPIHRPEAARAYLLKSFATAPSGDSPANASKAKPKKVAEEKEHNLALLLAALDLLYQSWAATLSAEDMDRRAWGWYVSVRPNVENGAEGWGGKNQVRLSQILDQRRQAT